MPSLHPSRWSCKQCFSRPLCQFGRFRDIGLPPIHHIILEKLDHRFEPCFPKLYVNTSEQMLSEHASWTLCLYKKCALK